jgi:hypothetical protein
MAQHEAETSGYLADVGLPSRLKGCVMAVSAKRIMFGVIIGLAPRFFSTPTHAGPVIPGQTITVSLSPSVDPLALGYDFKASKLYAVAKNPTDTTFVFGFINQLTGAFTGAPIAVGNLFNGLEFSIKNSNALTSTPAHAFILRNDGLLNVNVGTGMVSVKPAPSPNAPTAIGSDSLSAILYGRTSAGLADITPSTGAERIVVPYSYGGGFISLVSAVDPYHGVFFVEEKSGSGAE